MTGRSRKRIALVTDSLFGIYQSELRKAFERAAHRDDLDLVIVIGRGLHHPDPGERAQNQVYDWVTSKSVDGAVLLSGVLMNFAGSSAMDGLVERLGKLPKVSIGVELSRAPSVTVDNRAGMRAAVDHLLQVHGCRRIGYIAGPADNPEAKARLEGYRYAMEARFLPFDQNLVEYCPFTLDGGSTAMQRLLGRGRMFDAVVAANDAIAIGASQVLSARGLSVPSRIRMMSFDDSPLAVSALLSSVAQPFNQLALHALDQLKGVMQGRSVRDIAFCPRLALRRSCGCSDAESISELPAFKSQQRVSQYIAKHRPALLECLLELNASCYDWWSARVERLLAGLEAAVAGQEREFMVALDALVVEAFEDGIPVEQVGRSVTRLRRHLQGAEDAERLERLWNRALVRLTSTLGKVERERRTEAFERAEALRNATVALWGVHDEQQLAERLALELGRLGVQRAYLGLMSGHDCENVHPLLRLDPEVGARYGGVSHPVLQLVPEDGTRAKEPSTWMLSAINFGSQLTGVLACEGGTDVLVFEELRTQIGAVLEVMALRRSLMPEPTTVPRPRPMDSSSPPAVPPSAASREDTATSPKLVS